MRLVVDTNIFVSAALKEASWPAHTVRWLANRGGLLKTDATAWEILTVLARPRLAPKIAPGFLDRVQLILDGAENATIAEPIVGCRYPDDDKFLSLAVNGRADAIVSGDADLLILGVVRGIPIVTAAEFGLANSG